MRRPCGRMRYGGWSIGPAGPRKNGHRPSAGKAGRSPIHQVGEQKAVDRPHVNEGDRGKSAPDRARRRQGAGSSGRDGNVGPSGPPGRSGHEEPRPGSWRRRRIGGSRGSPLVLAGVAGPIAPRLAEVDPGRRAPRTSGRKLVHHETPPGHSNPAHLRAGSGTDDPGPNLPRSDRRGGLRCNSSRRGTRRSPRHHPPVRLPSPGSGSSPTMETPFPPPLLWRHRQNPRTP